MGGPAACAGAASSTPPCSRRLVLAGSAHQEAFFMPSTASATCCPGRSFLAGSFTCVRRASAGGRFARLKPISGEILHYRCAAIRTGETSGFFFLERMLIVVNQARCDTICPI